MICKSSWQKMSNLVLQFRGKIAGKKMRQVKISCGRNVKCQNEWGGTDMESKKVLNFYKALANLREIEAQEPPYDTVTETGMVALYGICFEQAWKAMKDRLEFSGYAEQKLGSPRAVIKLAYQVNMLADEQLWLDALQARNNVAHSYNEQIALGIIADSKSKFIAMFEVLKREIEENWV